jgi:carotenoid cleavage dioxygenase-like enzyme
MIGDFADTAFANDLLKRNLTHGTAETHDFGHHATGSEAVFAPAPGAAEDDGYVLPTRTT